MFVLAQRGTEGGSSLFGAPWWVALIGVVIGLAALALGRLWWSYRVTREVRKHKGRSRDRRPGS